MLMRDADDAAGIDDVVGRVEHAALAQALAIFFGTELVVCAAGHDRCAQLADRALIEDPAERARSEYIGRKRCDLVGRGGDGAELTNDARDGRLAYVSDDELSARAREQLTEVIADAAQSLDRNAHAGELIAIHAVF